MKKVIAGMAALAAVMMVGVGGASAAPLGSGQTGAGVSGESMVVRVESSYCYELRLGCEQKERLGEVGMGNCRRYRAECGGGDDYCARLRWECLHKEETGRVGEGLCRQYREECRGGDREEDH